MARSLNPCQLSLWEAPPEREGLPRPLDTPGATVWFLPAFLPPAEAAIAFRQLHAVAPWQGHRRQMYEREVAVPRLSAWYDGASGPWPEVLASLRRRVEAATGQAFDGVLCNRYRDGQDSVAWHSDDLGRHGQEDLIASLSLGATRRFLLRPKPGRPGEAIALALPAGSLLLMGPGCQQHWEHCVPKTRRPVGERINLTFRRHR